MKKSYHIAFISPFYRNIRKELVKMPNVYFFDTGLRNFFLGDYSPISQRLDKGAYAENIVFRELLGKTGDAAKIKFWRTQDKKEVDFVSEKKAYEVKFDANRRVKKSKYDRFKKQYPDIKFSILPYDKIMEKFYGWKM